MKRGVDSVSQRLLRCILFVAVLCSATPGWANLPFAGQHYPNGAEDFLTGALPPPGFYLKNYFVMVQKDRLMGTLPGVGDDQRAPVELEVDAKAIVPRSIWMTPWEVLGANLGMYALLPLYWVDAESAALRIDSDDSGLGDIYFGPMLDRHFSPNFHLGVGLEFVAPTGDYQEDDPASQIFSKNHWTIEPLVAMTYLWHGFDVSAKVVYDFNTKNDAYVLGTSGGPVEGDLKPGQELHVDYGISNATTEALRFGMPTGRPPKTNFAATSLAR